MNNLALERHDKNDEEIDNIISFNWVDNPAVQNLLDIMISIIAEEYIEIARQNPDIFSKKGGFK